MSTVNAEVALRLVAAGQVVPLVASFAYATSDPYAVRAAFHVGPGEPVEWIFARSLLADGVKAPAGHGDVLVWPSGDGQVLSISLVSPFGEALFEAPACDIADFLAITYRLVPAGSEPGHVDIDAELASLLAEGGPW